MYSLHVVNQTRLRRPQTLVGKSIRAHTPRAQLHDKIKTQNLKPRSVLPKAKRSPTPMWLLTITRALRPVLLSGEYAFLEA